MTGNRFAISLAFGICWFLIWGTAGALGLRAAMIRYPVAMGFLLPVVAAAWFAVFFAGRRIIGLALRGIAGRGRPRREHSGPQDPKTVAAPHVPAVSRSHEISYHQPSEELARRPESLQAYALLFSTDSQQDCTAAFGYLEESVRIQSEMGEALTLEEQLSSEGRIGYREMLQCSRRDTLKRTVATAHAPQAVEAESQLV